VTKAEVIDEVTKVTGLKKKDVTNVVEAVFQAITAQLKKHHKVQIVGFGTFEPRRRRARIGRDPRTQETIRIPASWSLGFRPGKQLKEIVSGKGG
jgi:DNA-binding protein HU-beta